MLIEQLTVHLGMATGAGCSSSSFSNSAEANASLPSGSEVSVSRSGKAVKRKRKVLTIEQKVEILNELSRGVSATIFSERYGVGKSTVSDIKKNKDSILNFKKKVTDMGMNKKVKIMKLDQIFNCDKTGLNFCLLLESTPATAFEKSVDVREKSKERVTVNACANGSGTIKLPLQLIGKAKRPKCFQRVNMDLLPVQYFAQKNS